EQVPPGQELQSRVQLPVHVGRNPPPAELQAAPPRFVPSHSSPGSSMPLPHSVVVVLEVVVEVEVTTVLVVVLVVVVVAGGVAGHTLGSQALKLLGLVTMLTVGLQ